jgi:hypothetical protein
MHLLGWVTIHDTHHRMGVFKKKIVVGIFSVWIFGLLHLAASPTPHRIRLGGDSPSRWLLLWASPSAAPMGQLLLLCSLQEGLLCSSPAATPRLPHRRRTLAAPPRWAYHYRRTRFASWREVTQIWVSGWPLRKMSDAFASPVGTLFWIGKTLFETHFAFCLSC